jgi:NADPH-dependent curcumin reductase CurA
MPGFNDTEAIAVYPTNPGDAFRVPTVEKVNGFDVHLEAEAGNGVTGPPGITPYRAAIQIRNLTQFKLVTVTTAAVNATGNIGVGQTWNTNDQEFIFTVAGGSADINPGDFLEVAGTVNSGNPIGAATNDFSHVRSEIFEVI